MNSAIAMVMMISMAGSAFALQLQPESEENEVRGEILEVSTDASTITLEESLEPPAEIAPDATQEGVVRTFIINESTKLTTSDGESIELAEISPGQQATIRYVMDYGNSVAKSVEVRTAATE